MKICIAFHSCMDLGGIINHTEQLIGGLQDLGHTVHLKELVYSERVKDVRKQAQIETGPSGIPFNQGKGWNFKSRDRIAYKTWAGVNSAKQILNGYDMVVWTVPVPPKNRQHLGNDKWPHLYDLHSHIRQVAFIHDGNAKNNSNHIYAISHHLSGIACVHECALNGAEFLTVPRALVLNPQHNPVRSFSYWDDKQKGFVNMQTFKAWKHVDDLVRAIAYMPIRKTDELRHIAGKGIEYQYMTSEDKCKETYFHGKIHMANQSDDAWFSGMKIWEAAEQNGMIHSDYWNTDRVDNMLQSARVLVDPSWSARYSKIGGHWNRVVVDAMMRGAVPVAHKLGMGNSSFKAGHHYIDVSIARDPQDYADIVLDAGNMNTMEARHYQDYARDLLPYFDRVNVAKKLVDLAFENTETQTGSIDKGLHHKYEDTMFNHYGILI